jgi:hypothetical protein
MSAPPSLPWFARTDESPLLEPGGDSIVIRASKKVSLGDTGGRIAVHGAVRATQENLKEWGFQGDHPLRAVVLGAMFQETEGAVAGNVAPIAPLLPGEDDSGDIHYFSVDLLEVIGAPGALPGAAFVFASIGPLVATPIRIQLQQ